MAKREEESMEKACMKGVKYLWESGVSRVPEKYIFPASDRPSTNRLSMSTGTTISLPIIDLSLLQTSNRIQGLESIAKACEEHGFFQVINHGVPCDVIRDMIDVSRQFFELPLEERAKYMSGDMSAPVRYGTSSNQNKDDSFCWRDFLKLNCQSLENFVPHWPSSPGYFRQKTKAYAEQMKSLFMMLIKATIESLGPVIMDDFLRREFEEGSQLMVINCYPPCPQPELTLGSPPHTDYGFLTLLLQDGIPGLQIQFLGEWVTVEPILNAFVVNIGDFLEIFSNGRYKSVLHRVLVNSSQTRISVASLHSLPINSVVCASPELFNEGNPKRYKDTNFSTYLKHLSSCELKKNNFLESIKLT